MKIQTRRSFFATFAALAATPLAAMLPKPKPKFLIIDMQHDFVTKGTMPRSGIWVFTFDAHFGHDPFKDYIAKINDAGLSFDTITELINEHL